MEIEPGEKHGLKDNSGTVLLSLEDSIRSSCTPLDGLLNEGNAVVSPLLIGFWMIADYPALLINTDSHLISGICSQPYFLYLS